MTNTKPTGLDAPKEQIVRVGTAGIVFNPRNPDEFLIGKRISKSHGYDTWQLPGGHLDFKEDIVEGAAREVLEETALEVEAKGVVALTNDVFLDEREPKHYITLFVACEVKDPNAKPVITEVDKCSEWRWVTWEGLKKLSADGESLFLPLENLMKQKASLKELRPKPEGPF